MTARSSDVDEFVMAISAARTSETKAAVPGVAEHANLELCFDLSLHFPLQALRSTDLSVQSLRSCGLEEKTNIDRHSSTSTPATVTSPSTPGTVTGPSLFF
jgi:hypothetical protein